MRSLPKPVAYDAVETAKTVIVILPDLRGDERPASLVFAPKGLQITRADRTLIRLLNVHPRLRAAANTKPVYAVEVSASPIVYAVGDVDLPAPPLRGLLGTSFIWFIGPETSTVAELAARPLPKLLDAIAARPVAVAPGRVAGSPLVGLCLARSGMLSLAQGRAWEEALPGLFVDHCFANGTAIGFEVADDIDACVTAAHRTAAISPGTQPRAMWLSQLAAVIPPEASGNFGG